VRFQDDAGNGTVRVAPGELIVQELYAPYARFIFRASGPPLFGWRAVTLGKPIRLCPLEISTYTNEEGEMFVRLSPLGGRFPLTITHPDSATLVALVQTFCAPAEPPANPA
jgi:hypothetical protein